MIVGQRRNLKWNWAHDIIFSKGVYRNIRLKPKKLKSKKVDWKM